MTGYSSSLQQIRYIYWQVDSWRSLDKEATNTAGYSGKWLTDVGSWMIALVPRRR